MDYNKSLDMLHAAEEAVWMKNVNTARADGPGLLLYPEKLPCRLEGGFINGSYNISQQIIFDNGITWFLRLPLFLPNTQMKRWLWRSKHSSSYMRRQLYLSPKFMLGDLQKKISWV
ncbi:hypothetical protein N7470_004309 [Penicillium chermesinum]|nr:hypothetical protein N7470_004309 [Penicillium chermesinum]